MAGAGYPACCSLDIWRGSLRGNYARKVATGLGPKETVENDNEHQDDEGTQELEIAFESQNNR
jgi:hypothetical protein